MEICCSHITALRWLMTNKNPSVGLRPSRARALPSVTPSDAELSRLAERLGGTVAERRHPGDGLKVADRGRPADPLVDDRLHLLVGNPFGRRERPDVVTHACRLAMPEGSFAKVGGSESDLVVASPELVFVELANELDLAGTVAVGYALCSRYRLDEGSTGGVAPREGDDAPLTTRRSLESFVGRAAGMHGVARTRQALRFVREGSRSPMESGIAMAINLPPRYGGFGIGEVELNKSLRLRGASCPAGAGGSVVREPDILVTCRDRYGSMRRAGVEYDADGTHLSSSRHARDTVRRNELQADGRLPHFSITKLQAQDYVVFTRALAQVRRAVGAKSNHWSPGAVRLPADARKAAHVQEIWASQLELWRRWLSAAKVTVGE